MSRDSRNGPLSRPDFDEGSVGNQLPDFLNLFIRYCDAAERPVMERVCLADPTLAVGQAVDEDVASGILA